MPKVNIPLDGGFYVSDSLPVANMLCTNWYVNIPQVEGAWSSANLFGGSGISEIANTGMIKQVNRGMHIKDGKPYFLNGETLIRIDSSIDQFKVETFTVVALGTIEGEGRVSMADNGKELMVLVPGGKGYIVDETSVNPFVEITAPGFTSSGTPQKVVFIDSYFVCSTDNKKFIRSDSNQGLVWNALNFFTAESDPDGIVSLQVYNNKLFVLGSEVTEEFNNNAGIFQRTGLFIDKGCFAKFSTIATNNSFMWIGGGTNESPAIWTLNGNTPVKISTTAIDSALQGFSLEEIEESFAYSYAKNGAYFVGFSLPTRTFEINTVTGKWNERTSQIINSKGLTETVRWRVNSLGTADNRILCGDSQDGRIGSIEHDTYTEYGNEILRTFSSLVISDQGNAMVIPNIEATIEAGAGDEVTEDPQIRLSISNDGKYFGNELSRSIGGIGETQHRAIWKRLGRFPRMSVIKLEMSDPVKPTLIKLEATIKATNRGR
jgi:hypothetical protein